MLTFTPAAVSSSTASAPAGVPGTLIIRLGRPIRSASASAAATEPAASCAKDGSSSKET
jgi:hypothetical protein